ncbi:MAG: EamA/RhaT family transporter [Oscillospiraceae bacterium]|jgi:drug/metabolite transporter (DMT)-like permease|nr:EamA/RhaT family transporter [Oscillospiraceae bacterium]
MMHNKLSTSPLLPSMLLLSVAFIWGGGFIFTNIAVQCGISPALLLTLRFFIPAAIMAALFNKELAVSSLEDLKFGLIAGTILFVAFFCQTYGIKFTTPANNAFLTATNVIMVPFLSLLLFKQKPGLRSTVSAFICFIGAAVLSWSPGIGITFNIGDWLSLLCAFLFACHYAYLGISAKQIRSAAVLSFFQLAVVSILSLVTFLIFERPLFSVPALKSGMGAILYLALFSTGYCYFVQSWAQRRFSASGTAIILSTEGLFGSLLSVLWGFDEPTFMLLAGGSIILISVILVQLDFEEIKRLLYKGRQSN